MLAQPTFSPHSITQFDPIDTKKIPGREFVATISMDIISTFLRDERRGFSVQVSVYRENWDSRISIFVILNHRISF